jgi:hypothetical protein
MSGPISFSLSSAKTFVIKSSSRESPHCQTPVRKWSPWLNECGKAYARKDDYLTGPGTSPSAAVKWIFQDRRINTARCEDDNTFPVTITIMATVAITIMVTVAVVGGMEAEEAFEDTVHDQTLSTT